MSIRTLQNDLEILSGHFAIQSEMMGRTNYWYWKESAEVVDMPGMSPQTALAFYMAEQHLSELMPPDTLKALEHHFNKAKEVLRSRQAKKQNRWVDKVITIPEGIKRYPPNVDGEIAELIYTALMEEKPIQATYWKPDEEIYKEYRISPVGLIQRGQINYLVGYIKHYTDHPNIFALHRFEEVEIVDGKYVCPKEFNLERFVHHEGGDFQYRLSGNKIKLEILMDYEPANLLEENPISLDQEVIEYLDDEEKTHFQMTVEDTMQLRAWLRSHGEQVKVLSKKILD